MTLYNPPPGVSTTNSNTWTGLQTFSRAGNASLLIGNSPQIVLNASSGLYGQALYQSAGSNKAATAWDSNGGLYFLASPFFRISNRIGSDETLGVSNSGVVINGLGSSNSYTLDVRGTFGVSTIGPGSVPYVDSNGGFVGDTNNIVYSGSRLFGVDQPAPTAVVHAGIVTETVGDSSNLILTVSPTASGFPIGFSSKNYEVWARKLTGAGSVYSVNHTTATASEPPTGDFDPTSGSASEQNGSGYDTAVDPPPSYEIYALYASSAARSNGSISFSTNGGSGWTGSNPFADVGVSWNTPFLAGYETGYLVIRNSSDYKIIPPSTLNFVDDNSGWTSSPPSLPVFQYVINGSFDAVPGATDYKAANTSDTTYTEPGTTSFSDINSGWISGTPPSTPTSIEETSLKSDGDTILVALGSGKFSIFGVTPVPQQYAAAGELTVLLQNYGLLQASGAGSYDINVSQATINNGTFNSATFNSTTTFNAGSTFNAQISSSQIVNSGLLQSGTVQLPIVSNVTTTGTLNNVSTSGASSIVFTGASAQTVTGFANPGNQKLLFVMNRAATALTLKDQQTSTAANQIITGLGGDYLIAPGTGATLQYDNTSSRWRIMGVGIHTLTAGVTGILPPQNGGMGIANNSASTITISGNFATTFTISNTTSVTLPTTGTLATLAGTETFTNKRITRRVVSMADATSFTPTGDTADVNTQTNTQAAGTLTANAPSGTPTDGQQLEIRVKSTNVQTFAWNAIYVGTTTYALTTVTTGSSKTDRWYFEYSTISSKWVLINAALGE